MEQKTRVAVSSLISRCEKLHSATGTYALLVSIVLFKNEIKILFLSIYFFPEEVLSC